MAKNPAPDIDMLRKELDPRFSIDNTPAEAHQKLIQLTFTHPELFLEMLRSDSESAESFAEDYLSESGNKALIDPLLIMLTDNAWTVRKSAAYILGHIGDEQVVDPLIALLDDPHSAVRVRAIIALGILRHPRGFEPVLVRLDDEDIEVRRRAALTLGKFGDTRALKSLINMALDAQRTDVERDHAARSLYLLGDERAIDPLIAIILENSDSAPRSATAQALVKFGAKRAIGALIEALRFNDFSTRVNVIAAIGQLGEPHHIEVIKPYLHDPLRDLSSGIRFKSVAEVGVKEATLIAVWQLSDGKSDLVTNFADETVLNHWIQQCANSSTYVDDSYLTLRMSVLRCINHPLAKQAIAEWDAKHVPDES